jgi:hypothetical protein
LPNVASDPEKSGDSSVSPCAGLCRVLPAFAAVKGQEKGNVRTRTPGVHYNEAAISSPINQAFLPFPADRTQREPNLSESRTAALASANV